MSILWGLTGSLDSRLASDSRPADVAHDFGGVSSQTNGKAVAEVAVSGHVNGREFRVVRRRSSKKSELHFTLDGKDLTTQAVKDTQTLMDSVLGIRGGLLQRCCFFGQHSHTHQVRSIIVCLVCRLRVYVVNIPSLH